MPLASVSPRPTTYRWVTWKLTPATGAPVPFSRTVTLSVRADGSTNSTDAGASSVGVQYSCAPLRPGDSTATPYLAPGMQSVKTAVPSAETGCGAFYA